MINDKIVIPKKLHMIWVGENKEPDYVSNNYNKWKLLMPDWEIKLWTNNDITSDYFPIDLIEKCIKGVQKADIMRYFIINKFGGVYMDCDVTPYKSLEPIITNYKTPLIICHDLEVTWGYIAIGFFASVPNHPAFNELCDKCHQVILNTEDIHMHTGPRLFGQVIEKYKNDFTLLPVESFYRNIKGDMWLNGYKRDDDVETRFGHHFYAKEWN
jgi:mannosyltransferase OCH1-like enzyme